MSEVNYNSKVTKPLDTSKDNIDRGSIGNNLNSDNAFSDNGLENIGLLNKAMKRENSEQP